MNKLQIVLLLTLIGLSFQQFISDKCACDSNMYMNVDNRKCEQYPTHSQTGFIDGCEEYYNDYNENFEMILKCKKCSAGKYLKTDIQCVDFSIQNCELAVESVNEDDGEISIVCDQCSSNYFKKGSDVCEAYPQQDGEQYIEHCLVYKWGEDSLECLQCIDGEVFVSGTGCQNHDIPHCKSYINLQECKECNQGHILQYDNMGCHPDPQGQDIVPNCVRYSTLDGESYRCEQCSGNFFLDYMDFSCQPINEESAVEFCQEYLSDSMCYMCRNNYFSPSANICIQCPPTDGSAAAEDFLAHYIRTSQDDIDDNDDKDTDSFAESQKFSVIIAIIILLIGF